MLSCYRSLRPDAMAAFFSCGDGEDLVPVVLRGTEFPGSPGAGSEISERPARTARGWPASEDNGRAMFELPRPARVAGSTGRSTGGGVEYAVHD